MAVLLKQRWYRGGTNQAFECPLVVNNVDGIFQNLSKETESKHKKQSNSY